MIDERRRRHFLVDVVGPYGSPTEIRVVATTVGEARLAAVAGRPRLRVLGIREPGTVDLTTYARVLTPGAR